MAEETQAKPPVAPSNDAEVQALKESIQKLEAKNRELIGKMQKKELIEPIQDIIFESVEKVAKKNRLQIIFDKSSEPVLLYTNPIHDYTDYVLEDLGLTEKNN